MSHMFRNADAANPDTSSWNTEKVTNMSFMFRDAATNPNMSAWDFTHVINMTNMFYGIDIGLTNYSNLLVQLAAQNSNENVALHGGNAQYDSAGAAARATLVANGWTITDGGPE